MRRAAVALALVVGLTVAPASAGPQMAPYAGVDQVAASIWLHQAGGRLTLYIAAGGRSADNHTAPPDVVGLPAYGLVGRGPCRVTKKKGGYCHLRGKIHPLVTEYEMDPFMESAHMTLDTGRYTHVVDWTGERTVSQDFDQEGTELYFYMFRPASAKATLYNKKFNDGDGSFMQNSVYAGDVGRLLQLHDDGTFSARVELDRNGNAKL